MDVDPDRAQAFATRADFGCWLAAHHAQESEIWVRIHKTASGIASITWGDAVVEALAWGWIDGIKKANNATSWFQRFTPRTRRSRWSQINRSHAERLIVDGRMEDAGLQAVLAAKADGHWDAAYAGSAKMVFPDAFLRAIGANAIAKATFDSLGRADLYPLFYRLETAKKEATRQAIITTMIDKLARGELPAGQVGGVERPHAVSRCNN